MKVKRKKGFEKELEEEVEEVESWVKERRKFFIKLAWVLGLLIVLLLASHYYLRMRGLGLW